MQRGIAEIGGGGGVCMNGSTIYVNAIKIDTFIKYILYPIQITVFITLLLLREGP